MTKIDILDYLTSHKEEIFQKYSLTNMGLFGSYATGHAGYSSDIDILIECEKKDFFLRDDLREYLQDVFGKVVDVGYADNVRQYYKKKIDKEIIYV
ncbi:MAG: nucleotidyltransferase domain-containing protein [Epsilonproteobacteria bacterium]|nr:nucleotidyltransferase domain-containing protein [Campylobacterota bacterium]